LSPDPLQITYKVKPAPSVGPWRGSNPKGWPAWLAGWLVKSYCPDSAYGGKLGAGWRKTSDPARLLRPSPRHEYQSCGQRLDDL